MYAKQTMNHTRNQPKITSLNQMLILFLHQFVLQMMLQEALNRAINSIQLLLPQTIDQIAQQLMRILLIPASKTRSSTIA